MIYNNDKEGRMAVFAETVEIVERGNYEFSPSQVVELPDDASMRAGSVLYSDEQPEAEETGFDGKTEITVLNEDCIVVGKELLDAGYKPAVLNLASNKNPGGGVINGASAQEESIFRRTNLYRSLYQFAQNERYGEPSAGEPLDLTKQVHYKKPLDNNYGGIYTPGATVFRATDFTLLQNPFQLSFITVAAIKRPNLSMNGHLKEHDRIKTKNKIRTILRMGLAHGHDSLVLGALGCGAYGNPPIDIASLFHQVLEEKEFYNKYKKIAFAVMGTRNFEPFRKEFA